MTRISRLILTCALMLLVLSSACNLPAQPPSIPTVVSASGDTSTPISIDFSTATPAPVIPITGMDVVSLQCQFCVNQEAHAVLIMSNKAFFNVADPESGVTCLSAQEVNGRRILLCRGAQNASFTLNVCVDQSNCLEFAITLQPCPLVPVTGSGTPTVVSTYVPLTPVILTPRNTLIPPTGIAPTGTAIGATATSAPLTPAPTGTGVVTPIPVTSTTEPPPPPESTSTPEPPTVEPPPPPQPSATSESTGGGGGGGGSDKLVICHISPGTGEQSTETVTQEAWDNVHSRHGDSLGAC